MARSGNATTHEYTPPKLEEALQFDAHGLEAISRQKKSAIQKGHQKRMENWSRQNWGHVLAGMLLLGVLSGGVLPLAAAFLYGIARVVTIGIAIYRQRVKEYRELAEKNRRLLEQGETNERQEAEKQRQASAAPRPPTRQERIAQVKASHQKTLTELEGAGLDQIELKSACEEAKKQYLNDLDRAMK